jgi:hypothetical protein
MTRRIGELQHDGLRLPIFDPEDVAWIETDIIRTGQRSADKFVRRARINSIETLDLKETLHIADSLFSLAAIQTHTVVIAHEWGVTPKYFDPEGDSPWLPDGYSLVAEVETIRDAIQLTPAATALSHLFAVDDDLSSQYIWSDKDYDQWVRGYRGNSTVAEVVLADIEPEITENLRWHTI